MSSDGSYFNVSSILGTKSKDSVDRPQPLKRKLSRNGIEPRSFCLPAQRLTARPGRLSFRFSAALKAAYFTTASKGHWYSGNACGRRSNTSQTRWCLYNHGSDWYPGRYLAPLQGPWWALHLFRNRRMEEYGTPVALSASNRDVPSCTISKALSMSCRL